MLAATGDKGELISSGQGHPCDDGRLHRLVVEIETLVEDLKTLCAAIANVQRVLDRQNENANWNRTVFGPRLPNLYEVADLSREADRIKQRIDDRAGTVMELYREWGVMPLNRWFSWPGAALEVLKCWDAEIEVFDGRDRLLTNIEQPEQVVELQWILPMRPKQYTLGQDLCTWMFPHLDQSRSKSGQSMRQFFDDDTKLKSAIEAAAKSGTVSPRSVRAKLKGGRAIPTNFPPMVAQAIFERYTPVGGTIWDPCGGWGGRMLGALTSRNDYTYIATEVDTRTVDCLRELGALIENVTGRDGSFRIVKSGSEDYSDRCGDVDCVFTSPPYYDAEDYGADSDNAEEQSHNKYPTLQTWVDGFVQGTVRNIAKALRPGGRAVINIADRTNNSIDIVDEWVRASLSEGLVLEDVSVLSLTKRPSRDEGGRPKKREPGKKSAQSLADYKAVGSHEPLLVFRRP